MEKVVIAVLLIVLLAVWMISVRQKLAAMNENINNAMNQIGVQLDVCFDMLMPLIELTGVHAARERENAFKNRLARRETFFALPRKKSRNGNEYVKYHGEIITLYPDKFRKGQWKAIFRGQYTNSCDTKEDALEEAFAILDPPVLGK